MEVYIIGNVYGLDPNTGTYVPKEQYKRAWRFRYRRIPLWIGIPMLLIILAIVVFGSYISVQSYAITQEFATQGRIGEGVITFRQIRSTSSDRTRLAKPSESGEVAFDFIVGGVTYSVRQIVSAEVYNRSEMNARVNVRYLPRDPATAIIDGTEYRSVLYFFLVTGFFALLAVVLMHELRKPLRPRFAYLPTAE